MLDHSLREVVFLNVQPEFPLVQLKAIPSSSIASYMAEVGKIALFSEPAVFCISPWCTQLKDKAVEIMKAYLSKSYLYFN